MIATEQLLNVFVEVADTLVDDFDLIDFLHTLTEHTAVIADAASVGLVLANDDARLHYMAASTDRAEYLELFQIQVAEGPCLECFRGAEQVIASDLGEASERWPTFAPRALAAGIRSVHAFPMRLRERTIGALNVFGTQNQPLDSGDVRVIQALADIATVAILQERKLAVADTLTEQLQGVLNSQILIEQAKGAVARANSISVDAAFILLRTHARVSGLKLTDVAHQVVNGHLDPTTVASAGGAAT